MSALPPIHLDNTLGAAFIGGILAAVLFGITNVQSLLYFQSSSRDSPLLRYTVGFLWTLDALHLALVSHVLYFFLVTNFTNLAVITQVTWSLSVHVIVTTVSDFVVRSFFARRVWILSRQNWLLASGAAICAFVTFVTGIGFAAKSFTFSSTLQFADIAWVLYLSLGSGVVADVWVAASLCWYLNKSRTGFKATDSTINVLMAYIINTGLLTSVCAAGCFVTYAAMPRNYVFIGFYFILSKLYFNSLLATLNARDKIRGGGSTKNPDSYQMPHLLNSSNGRTGSSFATSFPEKSDRPLTINVETVTDMHYHSDGATTKAGHVLPM